MFDVFVMCVLVVFGVLMIVNVLDNGCDNVMLLWCMISVLCMLSEFCWKFVFVFVLVLILVMCVWYVMLVLLLVIEFDLVE